MQWATGWFKTVVRSLSGDVYFLPLFLHSKIPERIKSLTFCSICSVYSFCYTQKWDFVVWLTTLLHTQSKVLKFVGQYPINIKKLACKTGCHLFRDIVVTSHVISIDIESFSILLFTNQLHMLVIACESLSLSLRWHGGYPPQFQTLGYVTSFLDLALNKDKSKIYLFFYFFFY